jgi:hypothetical protein
LPTFDDLARQLAEAPEPADRIAAAEALSRLDDSRVAPTLARALADGDAGVRARIEELLALFGRRDQATGLTSLLEEAERVASRLASEVQRLRGEVPQREEQVEITPLFPPDGSDEECAVIRLTGGPLQLDIKRAGNVVATTLGTPKFEATRELQTTKGFLARRVPPERAAELVANLTEARIVAGAVPESLVPTAPEPARVRDPKCTPDMLQGRLLPTGSDTMSWREVQLVVAGRIETEMKPDEDDETSLLGRLFRAPSPMLRTQPVYEYLVEVYGGEPVRRLRLVTHDLDFKTMQRRMSSFGTVVHMARELVRYADRGCVSAGVWRLADRSDDEWEDLTFLSPVAFDAYVAWQRLLLLLGLPLPR